MPDFIRKVTIQGFIAGFVVGAVLVAVLGNLRPPA